MNWQRFTKSAQRQNGNKSSRRVGFRPNLDVLEDRTLLTLTTFMIDPASSSLSLVGSTINLFGVHSIDEQSPGALNPTYEGTVAVDLDLDAGTINFLDAGTALTADISGNWKPMIGGGAVGDPGMDLANYGGTFNVLGGDNWTALRNMVMGAANDSAVSLTSLGGGAYTFPSMQNIKINAGALDYNTNFIAPGSTTAIDGLYSQNQAADGMLQDNGDGTFTLTAPVSASIFWDTGVGASVSFQFTGSITGTSSAGRSPTIGSHHKLNSDIPLTLVSGIHSAGTELFPNVLAKPVASGAVGLPASLSQAQSSTPDNAVAQPAHVAGVAASAQIAAIDAVFQDPLQNEVVLF